MPPLDVRQEPIKSPADYPRPRPIHPSPRRTKLGLERLSSKEAGYWGARFGIDTPYLAYALGWGEWSPLYGFDVEEVDPATIVELPLPILPP